MRAEASMVMVIERKHEPIPTTSDLHIPFIMTGVVALLLSNAQPAFHYFPQTNLESACAVLYTSMAVPNLHLEKSNLQQITTNGTLSQLLSSPSIYLPTTSPNIPSHHP